MSLWELFVIAVGLSMDAFAVSVCKGLSVSRLRPKHALLCGVWFGAFQAIMPLAGYLLGSRFASYIAAVDHWIAFGLLLLIGGNMIREALSKKEETVDASFGPKAMIPLAVATSIDALAVGVSFAFSPPGMPLIAACALIGLVTFCLCVGGALLAGRLRSLDARWAGRIGGLVLIGIGVRILIDTIL